MRGRAGSAVAGLALAALAALPGHATPPNIITAARFADPTQRYGHDVLGPGAEWASLRLTVDFCNLCEGRDIRQIVITLPDTRVFEDTAPRLADLDDDDIPEVVVIESDTRLGARLAIYDDEGLVAATPFIGAAHRWLAPLGAADLDGDGLTELAYIDRPHLARTLRVWRYVDRQLIAVAAMDGLTNHRIGQDFISGGIRDCGDGPEIVAASGDWRNLIAVRLRNGVLKSRTLGPFNGPRSWQDALNCGL